MYLDQTSFCFLNSSLLPDIWHRLKSLPQITGSEQARNRDVFKTLVTSITFTYMELPPSYEEAIQQPVEPFDNSSVGNFYRQVLLLQLSCFDIVAERDKVRHRSIVNESQAKAL